MSERIIIDMSRVEEALRLSSREREVVVERERAKNRARLIKYSAMGCALVIVSTGLAFWLGTQWRRYLNEPGNIIARLLQKPHENGKSSIYQNKIITDVNLFNSIHWLGLEFFNPYFFGLSAGHLYSSSNADIWQRAWCYASFKKDQMHFRVDLATRDQNGLMVLPVTQRELRELALSNADVALLLSRCPWRS